MKGCRLPCDMLPRIPNGSRRIDCRPGLVSQLKRLPCLRDGSLSPSCWEAPGPVRLERILRRLPFYLSLLSGASFMQWIFSSNFRSQPLAAEKSRIWLKRGALKIAYGVLRGEVPRFRSHHYLCRFAADSVKIVRAAVTQRQMTTMTYRGVI